MDGMENNPHSLLTSKTNFNADKESQVQIKSPGVSKSCTFEDLEGYLDENFPSKEIVVFPPLNDSSQKFVNKFVNLFANTCKSRYRKSIVILPTYSVFKHLQLLGYDLSTSFLQINEYESIALPELPGNNQHVLIFDEDVNVIISALLSNAYSVESFLKDQQISTFFMQALIIIFKKYIGNGQVTFVELTATNTLTKKEVVENRHYCKDQICRDVIAIFKEDFHSPESFTSWWSRRF